MEQSALQQNFTIRNKKGRTDSILNQLGIENQNAVDSDFLSEAKRKAEVRKSPAKV